MTLLHAKGRHESIQDVMRHMDYLCTLHTATVQRLVLVSEATGVEWSVVLKPTVRAGVMP